MSEPGRGHAVKATSVLFVIENGDVPTDRRVWNEALTLKRAGYRVSVICPRRQWPRLHERIEGISIYRYPLAELPGIGGHLFEYAIALPVTFILAWVVFFREGLDVIHAGNPPDFFYLMTRVFKLFGTKFIFDQHDLVPEMCLARWSGFRLRLTHALAQWMERATFRTADVVISPNHSYRRVAIERGRVDPSRIFVVRSAIRKEVFREGRPRPELRGGKRHLLCFLGTVGPNDGIDQLLLAMRYIVVDANRRDIQLAIVGEGDVRRAMMDLCAQLGLTEFVRFTGHVSDQRVLADYLATADVCVEPAPKNPLNDQSTMNKVVDYLSMGKPVVAFDLHEVRDTARGAGVYVRSNRPEDYGDQILRLLESPEERDRMGQEGNRRYQEVLEWDHQRDSLLSAYEYLYRHAEATSSGIAYR